ncbi:diaminobutyrate acetyltransferase [Haloglycomyces albus]|uniref:diaminobutyrate acetyltransferase n=1 Tax=Haloglycomyces albus TaxID=526067 RepID=UPI00046CEA3E|nr:diaminobutyrate acetyltransferase [Haloglycomyces albus]
MPQGDTNTSDPDKRKLSEITFDRPTIKDGPTLWQLVLDAGNLDVNSRYAYLLWCRDFADTTIVARHGDQIAGFITGYIRPDSPQTYFVWQVAVNPAFRRLGLALRMLDNVYERLGRNQIRFIETTVTPDNKASLRLFASFAEAHDADLKQDVLFNEHDLGEGHEPEVLHTIGPMPYADTK